MQGTPVSMQLMPTYENCLEDVFGFLQERVEFARQRGVQWLAVDPGIGFGKSLEHNLNLMSPQGINKLMELGLPVLIGLSRKSFLKALAERSNSYPVFDSTQAEMQWRDQQSESWERSCVAAGARIIRTHVIKTFT
jgi:dihydropteroate synthase